MDPIKIQFQNDMPRWEQLLADFKNGYPNTTGAMIRKNFPIFMILLGVLLAFWGNSGFEDRNYALCMIAPVLIFFGVLLFIKLHQRMPNADATAARNALAADTAKYAMYPDVRNYIDRLKSDLEQEDTRKKQIRKRFNFVFWGILAVMVIVVAVNFYDTYDKQNNGTLFNWESNDHFCKLLELSTNTPLLQIKPLTTEVGNGLKTDGSTLQVYLGYFSYQSDEKQRWRALEALSPAIYGDDVSGKFRLTITDENGKAIRKCPFFVFSAGDRKIRTSHFCTSLDGTKPNEFETLQTLRYLQTNKDRLLYVVEKL